MTKKVTEVFFHGMFSVICEGLVVSMLIWKLKLN
jgi:hypothetical protein